MKLSIVGDSWKQVFLDDECIWLVSLPVLKSASKCDYNRFGRFQNIESYKFAPTGGIQIREGEGRQKYANFCSIIIF